MTSRLCFLTIFRGLPHILLLLLEHLLAGLAIELELAVGFLETTHENKNQEKWHHYFVFFKLYMIITIRIPPVESDETTNVINKMLVRFKLKLLQN